MRINHQETTIVKAKSYLFLTFEEFTSIIQNYMLERFKNNPTKIEIVEIGADYELKISFHGKIEEPNT